MNKFDPFFKSHMELIYSVNIHLNKVMNSFHKVGTYLVAQMVKESAYNARDLGLIPGLGRSPGEGNGNPLQYSCLENPMDKWAWLVAYVPCPVHGGTKSQIWLSNFTKYSFNPQLCVKSLVWGGLDDKKSACDVGDPGWIPGSGKSPGERKDNLLQYSCLENSMDRRLWWATVHGVTKSQTLAEWLSQQQKKYNKNNQKSFLCRKTCSRWGAKQK